jgi:hypothetical protein
MRWLLMVLMCIACKRSPPPVPPEFRLPVNDTTALGQVEPVPEPAPQPLPTPVVVEAEVSAVDAGSAEALDEATAMYSWVNAEGVTEFVQGLGSVPEPFRAKATRVEGQGGSLSRQALPAGFVMPSSPLEPEEPAVEVAPEAAPAETGKNEFGESAHGFALRSSMGLPVAPPVPPPPTPPAPQ